MGGNRVWPLIALWAALGVLAAGCAAPQRVTTISYPGLSSLRIGSLGVMPFFKGRHPADASQTARCSLGKLAYDPEKLLAGADLTLTRYVYDGLSARYGPNMIKPEKLRKVHETVSIDTERDTPLTVTRRVGGLSGAKLMVFGAVWRYMDRSGSPMGSASPASVAFDLYLLDVNTGEIVWSANYDETQRSLSENLFDIRAFFKRGAKWLTANELARYGVEEVLERFPI